MPLEQIVVTLGGIAAIGLLAWFFFGPKRAQAAQVKGNVQEIEVMVKGGYSPDIIRVKKGILLRLVFDRREAGDCSSRWSFRISMPARHWRPSPARRWNSLRIRPASLSSPAE